MQDEDSEETGEDVTRDNSWNYADILWNGIRADAVQAAFDKLSRKEKFFLEKRNAICMNCGQVMPWDERYSFEQLAAAYEYSTTSGAERAYKKIVDKLTGFLVDAGVLGVVELLSWKWRKYDTGADRCGGFLYSSCAPVDTANLSA